MQGQNPYQKLPQEVIDRLPEQVQKRLYHLEQFEERVKRYHTFHSHGNPYTDICDTTRLSGDASIFYLCHESENMSREELDLFCHNYLYRNRFLDFMRKYLLEEINF